MYWNRHSDDKFFFFWSGPFSQWAIRPMVVAGDTYNCCEQYMMAKKAVLFNDGIALDAIMHAADPADQKKLGRKVRNFVEKKWNDNAREFVYQANYAKFSQHKDLLDNLRNTGDRIIVEASPYDTIWGIALHASDPRAKDPSQWRGKNWLGECIMRVRDQFRLEGKL